jgi:hypothetical protein
MGSAPFDRSASPATTVAFKRLATNLEKVWRACVAPCVSDKETCQRTHRLAHESMAVDDLFSVDPDATAPVSRDKLAGTAKNLRDGCTTIKTLENVDVTIAYVTIVHDRRDHRLDGQRTCR